MPARLSEWGRCRAGVGPLPAGVSFGFSELSVSWCLENWPFGCDRGGWEKPTSVRLRGGRGCRLRVLFPVPDVKSALLTEGCGGPGYRAPAGSRRHAPQPAPRCGPASPHGPCTAAQGSPARQVTPGLAGAWLCSAWVSPGLESLSLGNGPAGCGRPPPPPRGLCRLAPGNPPGPLWRVPPEPGRGAAYRIRARGWRGRTGVPGWACRVGDSGVLGTATQWGFGTACPALRVGVGAAGASCSFRAQSSAPRGHMEAWHGDLGSLPVVGGRKKTMRRPLRGGRDSVPALDDQLPAGGRRPLPPSPRTAGCSRRPRGGGYLLGPRRLPGARHRVPFLRSRAPGGGCPGPGPWRPWGAVPPGDAWGVARTGQGCSGWLGTGLTQPALTDAPSWRRSPVGPPRSALSLEAPARRGVTRSPGPWLAESWRLGTQGP